MKALLISIFFLSSVVSFAQNQNCEIDYVIKNDSTDYKKTKDYLIVERNYGRSIESVYVSLIQSEGLHYLQFQYLQKEAQFISTSCVDQKSMISLQLLNGSIINLRHANMDLCNSLSYDSEQNANIRILSTYFQIQKEDLNRLKASPASIMRIRFATDVITYELVDKIESKTANQTFYPSDYFLKNIHCIE